MDKERIAFCEKACFLASTAGYIGKIDSIGFGHRMTLVAADGTDWAGEWKDTKQEAVESCCKVFMANFNHNAQSAKKV